MVGRSFPAFLGPAQSRVAYFRLVLPGTLLTDLRNAILSLFCCVLLLLTCLCYVERHLVAYTASARLSGLALPVLCCPVLRSIASPGLPHSVCSFAPSALHWLTPCAYRRVLCLKSWARCIGSVF